jgi:hypothetical protein
MWKTLKTKSLVYHDKNILCSIGKNTKTNILWIVKINYDSSNKLIKMIATGSQQFPMS